jgi:hypothetical protein
MPLWFSAADALVVLGPCVIYNPIVNFTHETLRVLSYPSPYYCQ